MGRKVRLLLLCKDTYLERRRGEKHVCGLDHVSCVDVVVVSNICMIILLQGHHEGDKSVCGDLEGLEEVSLLMGQIDKGQLMLATYQPKLD